MNEAILGFAKIVMDGLVEVEKYRIDRTMTERVVRATVERQAIEDDKEAMTVDAKVAMLNNAIRLDSEVDDD